MIKTTAPNAYILVGTLTTIGGGGYSPWLLAKELADMGVQVTVFTGYAHDLPSADEHPENLTIVTPVFRKGYRFRIPDHVLLAQILAATAREKPQWIFNVGVTYLTRLLMKSPIAGKVIVWENINASMENHLIDAPAASKLNRCRCMLAPAPRVDALIRTGYNFEGDIYRLPFWVEPELPRGKDRPEYRTDFLFLARKDPDKGHVECFEALARLKEEGMTPSVTIAGSGGDQWILEAASRFGVSDQVRLDFFKDRQSIMDALCSSKCLLLPSRSEGYPLVILEALAQGRPVLASDTGGVADLLDGVACAEVIEPGNVDQLTEAIRRLTNRLRDGVPDVDAEEARNRFVELNSAATIRKNVQAMLEKVSL